MSTVRDVVRDIVAATAPHELPVFDGVSSLGDDEVTRVFRRPRSQRDPIAFGVTDVAVLVSPVVWLVVDEVARRGVGAVAEGLFARLKSRIARSKGRRSAVNRTVPSLTPAQLDEVHDQVRDRAAAAGISGESAHALADAVVSRLARTVDQGPERSTGTTA